MCVLECLDARTLVLVAPLVCRRWAAALREVACVALEFSWAEVEVGAPSAAPLTMVSLPDEALRVLLAQRFRAVWRLDLTSCQRISAEGWRSIGTDWPAVPGSLRNIDLSFCDQLSDGDLEILVAGLPNLHELSLRYCSVSDRGLAAVAACCPALRRLWLDCCELIEGDGLLTVARGCPLLAHLSVSWCPWVTNNILTTVATCCPRIMCLELHRDAWPATVAILRPGGATNDYVDRTFPDVADTSFPWHGLITVAVVCKELARLSLDGGATYASNDDLVVLRSGDLNCFLGSGGIDARRSGIAQWNCL